MQGKEKLAANAANSGTNNPQPGARAFRALFERRLSGWKNAALDALQANPAEFWRRLLYCSFWLYLALFPIGYGWREVMPPLCFVFLLLYYRHGWKNSSLANLNARWLFYCLWIMVGIGILFSINPAASLIHAGSALSKGLIAPFIAMECARDERELAGLVWALAFACFWQGLDGVWQALYGADFIMGYVPNAGRLTGSIGDYDVGNYMALAMIPAFGVWYILHEKFGAAISWLLFASLFWPAFFLFQGASSRSGLIAIVAALCLWIIIARKRPVWFLLPCALISAFMLFQPGRLSVPSIAGDNRWDLWHLGWRVFLAHPITGAGAGEYNEAFKALGLLPLREEHGISHPHNLYLDILYAHGLIGFALGMTFICGFLIWVWRKIRQPLALELRTREGIYWRLTLWFWLGYVGWLANGIFGHHFYYNWWLAEAMISLGVAIGASVRGTRACLAEKPL